MQTIVPILRYIEARRAIQWLCSTFGFVERFSVPASGPLVRHAQLQLGPSIIMLGSVRPEEGVTSPHTLGAATQALYVQVDDVDAHHRQTRASGAPEASPPQTTEFGARQYQVRDLEGHLWIFGSVVPRPDVRAAAGEAPVSGVEGIPPAA